MKFCISGQWPVADILPTSNEAASALAALRLYREFVRLGLSPVKAFPNHRRRHLVGGVSLEAALSRHGGVAPG